MGNKCVGTWAKGFHKNPNAKEEDAWCIEQTHIADICGSYKHSSMQNIYFRPLIKWKQHFAFRFASEPFSGLQPFC